MKKNILRGMLFAFTILITGIVHAQTLSVSGTVSDATGPFPGSNVAVKGTDIGTVTDFDGKYTLNNVPQNGTLIFSFVGFVVQEIPVNGRTSINVALAADAAALDEIVVIGYGNI